MKIETALRQNLTFIAVVYAVALSVSIAHAQGVALIPIRKSPSPQSRFDESTQWALHLKGEVQIHSPLLRLRDLASPPDPSAPWWDRVGNSVIGMMPVDGQTMIVERERLKEAVARSTSMPNIQWSGASEIKVTLHREPEPGKTEPRATSHVAPAVLTTDHSVAKPRHTIVPSERDRIVRLIQYAIDRYDVNLSESFDIEIDPNQSALDEMIDLRRVDTIMWDMEPHAGINDAKITGMNSREPIESPVEVGLKVRPLVVCATSGLRRGHILTATDLELIPAPRNLSLDGVVTDIDEIVGLQVNNVLLQHRPITHSLVGPVVVIQRGELVELRVVGGGVTVATTAKSLAQGATGDLIPIETVDPRKKLMARVIAAGQVEIVTRPPRVQ